MSHDARKLVRLREQAAELRDDFVKVASELDKLNTNTAIAQIFGGIVGVAGGLIAIAGVLAIPFTAGSSALLGAVGGSIVGSAGGMTASGAAITSIFIERANLIEVETKWKAFCQVLLKVQSKKFQNQSDRLERDLESMGYGALRITNGIRIVVRGGENAVRAMGANVARVALTVAGSAILNVITVGFSISDIVAGSIELSNDKGSKAGSYLRKLAKSLDVFAKTGKWHCKDN